MAIENEVFRFVTLRKADPTTSTSSVSVGTASSYDGWADAELETNSAVMDDLVAAKGANPNTELKSLREEAGRIRGANRVMKDVEALNAAFPKILDFFGWLKGQDTTTITSSKVASELNRLTGHDAAYWLGQTASISLLWDTLVVESIEQKDPQLSQSVLRTLKVINLLTQLGSADFGKVYVKALDNIFILPKAIFPINKEHREYTPQEPSTDIQDEIAQLNTTIKTISAALADIKRARETERENARPSYEAFPPSDADDAEVPAPPANTPMGYWSQAFVASLGADTVRAVTTYAGNISPKFRTDVVEQRLNNALREAALKLGQYAKNKGNYVVNVNGVLLEHATIDPGKYENLQPDHSLDLPDPINTNPCKVEPLGVAEYRRVVQKLVCYKAGEIAHIENVLKTESKSRTTRELRQREETIFTSTETEREELKDTQTTDRFEIQRESEKVIQTDMQASAGINFHANYGTVQVDGGASFAVQTSKQESSKSAFEYAHSVTQRAMQRLLTKTRTDKTVRLLYEFEDTSEHKLDNTAGTDHVVGIFRWVDKEYECSVVNYGKRMMFNFMIPEPGAWHVFANTSKNATNLGISKPLDPRTQGSSIGQPNLLSAADIHVANYLAWGAAYGADIEAYPKDYLRVSKSYFSSAPNGSKESLGGQDDIPLPEGYQAIQVDVNFYVGQITANPNGSASGGHIKILIGNNHIWHASGPGPSVPETRPMSDEEGVVPLNYLLYWVGSSGFNVEILTKVSDNWITKWRIKAYEAIMAAYEAKMNEYQNALAKMQNEAGIYIAGTNPLMLRQYERLALKKGAIQLLMGEYFGHKFYPAHNPDISNDGGVDNGDVTKHYPWFENCFSQWSGLHVEFFEMAFQWELMSYNFFPYFWGKHDRWSYLYKTEDADSVFTSFLQAGYAQMLLSVRPGFEEMVIYFLQTGQIWQGLEKPALSANNYMQIMEDMKKEEANAVGTPDENIKPWKLRLPTNLVILQKDADGIEGEGLPCDPSGI